MSFSKKLLAVLIPVVIIGAMFTGLFVYALDISPDAPWRQRDHSVDGTLAYTNASVWGHSIPTSNHADAAVTVIPRNETVTILSQVRAWQNRTDSYWFEVERDSGQVLWVYHRFITIP